MIGYLALFVNEPKIHILQEVSDFHLKADLEHSHSRQIHCLSHSSSSTHMGHWRYQPSTHSSNVTGLSVQISPQGQAGEVCITAL